MRQLCDERACDQLVVCRLIQCLLGQFFFWGGDAAAHKWCVQNGVDFVKGQPVGDFVLVALKQYSGIAFVKGNQLSVCPSVVVFCQIQRRLIVRDRNERLDPVFVAFIKQAVIKGKPGFVWLCFIPFWKNPAPCD